MKGLIIREPWIGLILSGAKTWEMRSRPTTIRGTIALIRGGSGLVCGTAELVDSLPALTNEQMRANQHLHGIPEADLDAAVSKGWNTPWMLQNVRRLDPPVSYIHPSGAVIWVTLPELITKETQKRPDVAPEARPEPIRPVQPQLAPTLPLPAGPTETWTDIRLTAGNLRYAHIYLRTAECLIPVGAIGGSNKSTEARTKIRVQFQPGMQIETDLAGDKMIMRARGPVRDFFERSGARVGDCVRFRRTGKTDFELTLRQTQATNTVGGDA